jgi:hypothetical protein
MLAGGLGGLRLNRFNLALLRERALVLDELEATLAGGEKKGKLNVLDFPVPAEVYDDGASPGIFLELSVLYMTASPSLGVHVDELPDNAAS